MTTPIALPSRIITKSAFGAPCTHCGLCCQTSACRLAQSWLNAREGEPCPALQFENGLSGCGLITSPSHYLGLPYDADRHLAPQIAEALGAGRGCDAEYP